MTQSTTLFLLSGKIASGKSTLAKSLAEKNKALLVVQDDWLATLYPEEIKTIDDYAICFDRLSKIMGQHLVDILKMNISVVLDFPANTIKVRTWMKSLAVSAHCKLEVHFLDTPNETCLSRLALRNQGGEHKYKVSESEFELFTSYFVPPSVEEGLEIQTYRYTVG